MKIMTINCFFKQGSTGCIIQDIDKGLCKEYEFLHCYEIGSKPTNRHEYRIASKIEFYVYYILARLLGIKYGTGYTSTLRLLHFIKKTKPNIVHIHCPNCYTVNLYWLLNYLKQNSIKTVITHHAEFFYTGNCPHAFECKKYKTGCGHCDYVFDSYRPFLFDRTAYEWKKMKQAFQDNPYLKMVVVSPWQAERMMSSPITQAYSPYVIYNGVDVDGAFHPQENLIKKELGIEGKKMLLHVTASFSDAQDDPKGGRYILRLAEKLKNTAVVVAGPNLMTSKNFPPNIIFLGSISDRIRLAQYYSAADLSIITSKRETFGMACAESLCCGTPIIGFQAGGPESISMKEYSEFVPYGDERALFECVQKWLHVKENSSFSISHSAAKVYSKQRMAEQYGEIYKSFNY